MKKTLTLLAAIFAWFLPLVAHPVDQEIAQSIAIKFMGTNDLQISTTYTTDKNATAFYVFNTSEGFVIVSADDCETPIIAYSREGRFNPSNVPVQMEDYLQEFVERIKFGIENHIEADELTARQWELVKATGRLNDQKNTKSVEPLLNERWHQGHLYNNLCPAFEKVPCGHAEVGCAALAMGMIMHYWKYPTTGWGSHTYSSSGLTLSADFGNTVYDWEHMPDSLTDDSSDAEITAVATLLYHCGVALNMRYSNNVSLANSRDVPNAMFRYFNYSRYLQGVTRGEDNDEWMALLKNDLDSLRPVYYSGQGNVGGHAFVCDGYDENDLLHFNWGWGGSGNGYFALGNLNPNGYGFNDSHYAIFGINPHFDPWMVSVSVIPPMAGTIEGVGGYHIGETCTLTAWPAEGYEFFCWKRNGHAISYGTSLSVDVLSDIDNIEAEFFHLPATEIAACYVYGTNNVGDTCVNLSWHYENTEWVLLNWFPITQDAGGGVATDGEHIYVSNYYMGYTYSNFMFEKYTMEGEFVEAFDLDTTVFASDLTYDGNYFYCSSRGNMNKLYCVDLANKTLIDITELENMNFLDCAYDHVHDGIWILNRGCGLALIDRQGQLITSGPQVPNEALLGGMGFTTSKDGTQHLLLANRGSVYDYNITDNTYIDRPIIHTLFSTYEIGAFIGKYDGKEAMFIRTDNSVSIYEIKSTLAQILGYRLYRAQEEGDTIVLVDRFEGASYTDSTWADARAGMYRFGISSVFANGNESEIVWSNPIVKTDYGVDENTDDQEEQPVQKVLENGQIIIIKDGKRYNVLGQPLN